MVASESAFTLLGMLPSLSTSKIVNAFGVDPLLALGWRLLELEFAPEAIFEHLHVDQVPIDQFKV